MMKQSKTFKNKSNIEQVNKFQEFCTHSKHNRIAIKIRDVLYSIQLLSLIIAIIFASGIDTPDYKFHPANIAVTLVSIIIFLAVYIILEYACRDDLKMYKSWMRRGKHKSELLNVLNVNFNNTLTWNTKDIRELCRKNNYFAFGTSVQYEKFLNFIDSHPMPTRKQLIDAASVIAKYSIDSSKLDTSTNSRMMNRITEKIIVEIIELYHNSNA